ncbi:MAG: hypothetical protein RIC56_01490 [Pseudomonadales bacterium]
MVIAVTVYHNQDHYHCSQIYTGLGRLWRQGTITLKQRSWRQSRLADLLAEQPTIVLAEVGGRMVCFDMRDTAEIDLRFLDEVDWYFKRGFECSTVSSLGDRGRRIRPLGLNYDVWDDGVDWPAVWRLAQGTGSVGSCARRLGLDVKFQPRMRVFERDVRVDLPPRVLFLTRVWGASRWNDSQASRRDRDQINESRIACVRALKAELGAAFVGGLAPTDLARKMAPDLICPAEVAAKPTYLRLVKKTPICVTTTGLHGSNGWKLGEYVAMGRAIVSEPLRHEVPGDFAAGKNYLPFSLPDECVGAVVALMENRGLRTQMMLRNLDYYRNVLRPDALVRNALEMCLRNEEAPERTPLAVVQALARH